METRLDIHERTASRLHSLVEIFFDLPSELARFEPVMAEDMPQAHRELLAHNEHMTVTLEAWHDSPVDLRVLETKLTSSYYARSILLLKTSDASVVQFGIVRLRLDFFQEDVRQKIESRRTPLGRILIQHNVMRQVELVSLWRVLPAASLSKLFASNRGDPTFGRTAIIHCDSEPAIELLEIVAPT